MNTVRLFEQTNEPNAGKLIESLRHLGYDNYVAIADIVDNSIDAEADTITIHVWTENGSVRLMIGDNGCGMDREDLDQALKLGSLTAKDPVSDLGKFGMGLVTAGLSLARRTTVITRQGSTYLTSIVDVDEVKKENRFCKYLGGATPDERRLLDEALSSGSSGTIVVFDKCDGIRNTNTTVFANTLRKHLGRIHRFFVRAGKSILVNGEPATVVDPLELDTPGTEIFSDDEYPIVIKENGRERNDTVRVRIALIPENVAGGEYDVSLGLSGRNARRVFQA
jgi:anti-sigma regulatory factor (Ser/Thr protein kinase)